ncbi:hypothetical protein [Saccharothrix sp. ST-888]|uniref:hypothetical protein n=1 Tax=Saccharothrix sp. ST-888 TaxID=1427391 RepID=UPI0012E0585C|nr:hypothetical protein [Saccharothrix sp. ST-888]
MGALGSAHLKARWADEAPVGHRKIVCFKLKRDERGMPPSASARPKTLVSSGDAAPQTPSSTPAASLSISASGKYPYHDDSIGLACRLVENTLANAGLDKLIGKAVAVTRELVTISVSTGCKRHLLVEVSRKQRMLRITVRDGSRELPVWFLDGSAPLSGLALVHTLAEGDLRVEIDPDGKTMCAQLRIGQAFSLDQGAQVTIAPSSIAASDPHG